ncbi:hypothetical protein KJ969_05310, partial [Patescibacteria group bacterium]|nr:hypothetical protein [Patescibacteria group bacterium]
MKTKYAPVPGRIYREGKGTAKGNTRSGEPVCLGSPDNPRACARAMKRKTRRWESMVAAFILLLLVQTAFSQVTYNISSNKQSYYPNEYAYLFISGEPNTQFTVKIIHDQKIIQEIQATTSSRGNAYLHTQKLLEKGEYQAAIYVQKRLKTQTQFSVDSLDTCPSCIRATTTSTTTIHLPTYTTTSTSTTSTLPSYAQPTTTTSSVSAESTTKLSLLLVDESGKPRIGNHVGTGDKPSFKFTLPKKNTGGGGYKRLHGLDDGVQALLYDSKGYPVDVQTSVESSETGEYSVVIEKKRRVRAGLYTLRVVVTQDGETFVGEQEFAWGLVSLNTRKSIYRPGEVADFIIVVLDSGGRPVCGAGIELNVTDTQGTSQSYSTMENTITRGSECGLYDAVYEAGAEGTHLIDIKAVVDGRLVYFTTQFLVKQSYEFDIIREADSKIDPTQQKIFNVTI